MDDGKFMKSLSAKKIRLFFQASAAIICNSYFAGFFRGRIYQGATKSVCVPGLNCYSCPGAVGSCPLGSLQATLGARQYRMPFYVLGTLTVFGALLGRTICGFLCPFGLLQDILNKIPFFKKIRNLPGERFLRFVRYAILAVFVIILPLCVVDITGIGEPWFCKYICPTGTLEGGIPLVLMNEGLRASVGFLYAWKIFILGVTVFFSILMYRPFCRYICPLGAIYGVFNKFSLRRYSIDNSKCTKCGKCQEICGLDIKVWKNPNSIDCIRCGDCKQACPTQAIR